MALTFELSEPPALAAGCSLVNASINSGPKLALSVHKMSHPEDVGCVFLLAKPKRLLLRKPLRFDSQLCGQFVPI